ncbi:cytochrome c3 family protein [Pedobacter mucosus]|uniref:cytochrome c3 family protein n=1 Tax=Pedobacter mucosus TaxID=2895286 RepID=UPI001EE412E2|nr:cytochrome c3 family protein [Pedobacter mucosus]UKT62976.1 cytochrome c family protein [Pedobacter mucosus]
MGRRRFFLIFCTLAIFVFVAVQCTQVKIKSSDSRGPAYAGSATCVSCHKNLSASAVHNAHLNASKMLTKPNSADSLHIPDGDFIFNEQTKVQVKNRVDGLYQSALINGFDKKTEHTDMIFGAGKSAYTFAFWYGKQLMQMPLNYLTKEHQWVNSPGFPDNQIYFGRPIISRCLECHSSFADKKLIQGPNFTIEEEYVKNSIIAGIDCERCHGPAAQHVTFQQENPTVKTAKYIVSYKKLALSQRVDLCGVCHSGTGIQTVSSTFGFKPGDTLKTLPQYSAYRGEDPDVHGKQKQLLEASLCYKVGKAECITCHNIHDKSKPSVAIYSSKCISCHQDVKHETLKKNNAMLAKNCIDCHMPVKESHAIGFQMSNSKEKIPYKLHTHRIAIYKDLVKGE